MPKIAYAQKVFSEEHTLVIERANRIITAYQRQGYDLTLRQLYYQFVSRNWMENKDKNYKRLGTIISDGRRAGLIDWDRIVDRTRFIRNPASWDGPEELVSACARQFDVDWWEHQTYRPEVWIEKDALVGVLDVACEPWHCPYFSCRGYTSDSEAWAAGRRLKKWADAGHTPIVFHLGDHDPSGIDMTRDIEERINLFCGDVCRIEVRRIALNMAQIEELNPPPNPAKQSDSRFADYQERFGDESWELDALDPAAIGRLIAEHMEGIVEKEAWRQAEEARDEGRRLLSEVSDNWERLTDGL